MDLSIIIPLFNEAGRLENNFAHVARCLASMGEEIEVLLTNDGSTDDTLAICRRIADQHGFVRLLNFPSNRGKGFAVRSGILNARGKFVIFMDADLAVPVDYIRVCFERLLQGALVVIASRHLPDSVQHVREGFFRQILGEAFRQFSRLSLNLKVSDVTCGLKGFKTSAAQDLFSRSHIDRWAYDAEILFLARVLGYPIEEIPVEWSHSFDSKVKLGLDSARTFWEMLKIQWFRIAGTYQH